MGRDHFKLFLKSIVNSTLVIVYFASLSTRIHKYFRNAPMSQHCQTSI